MNLYITEKLLVQQELLRIILIILVLTLHQPPLTKKQIPLFSLILTVIVLPGALATCSDYWILKNTIQSTQAGMKHYFPSIQKN